MKNEILLDRSSIAYQEHVEFNGLEEVPAGDPLVSKPVEGSVSIHPNAVIGIPAPVIPEK